MPIVAGATLDFVEAMIQERISKEFFSLSGTVTLYLMHNDFESLRRSVRSDSEMTILTGLVSQKQVDVAVDRDLRCQPEGAPTYWHESLLRLAICFGRALFTLVDPGCHDRRVFARNLVDVVCGETEAVSWIIRKTKGSRVLAHWILHDGGAQRPRDIIGSSLISAEEIVLFDRYFRQWSVDTLTDALDFARTQRGSPLRRRLTLFLGEPGNRGDRGYVDYGAIAGLLTPYLASARQVGIEKVQSVRGKRMLHDRFMQIDSSCTFIFSAGIGCFFEGGGAQRGVNRSSHIFQVQVSPDYEEFDFEAGGRGTRRRCVIRT